MSKRLPSHLICLALISICVFSTTLSFAGNEGHGGDGVLIAGTPYLLDLVEWGIEFDPFMDSSIVPNPTYIDIISEVLTPLNSEKLIPIVARKLTEISKVDLKFAESLVQRFTEYNWRLVNKRLVDIQDEDTVLDYNDLELVQLAIRRNGMVRISREYWSKMNVAHQTALLLHEVIYSFSYSSGFNEVKFFSDSARTITGYLFTPEFRSNGIKGLRGVVYNSNPGHLLHIGFKLSATGYYKRMSSEILDFCVDPRLIISQKGGSYSQELSAEDSLEVIKEKIAQTCTAGPYDVYNKKQVEVSLYAENAHPRKSSVSCRSKKIAIDINGDSKLCQALVMKEFEDKIGNAYRRKAK